MERKAFGFRLLAIFLIVAACFLFSYHQYRKGYNDAKKALKPGVIEVIKTIHDTIPVPFPVEAEPEVIISEIPVPVLDSAAIFERDSLRERCAYLSRRGDSLIAILSRTQRHYSDSTYDAWVSGYDPRLDSLRIYGAHTVVLETRVIEGPEYSPFSIGLSAGVGLSSDGSVKPIIGVTGTYSFIRFKKKK